MMSPVDSIANYILDATRSTGELVSPLKLQKLVYYAQAWHLALHEGRPLFSDDIEAWVHGPVVPALYLRFKDYKWNPVTEDVTVPPLPPDTKEHLDAVLEVYGGMSAWDLERLTHAEEPWIEARAGMPPDESSNAKISPKTMQRFYAARAASVQNG